MKKQMKNEIKDEIKDEIEKTSESERFNILAAIVLQYQQLKSKMRDNPSVDDIFAEDTIDFYFSQDDVRQDVCKFIVNLNHQCDRIIND